MVGDSSLPMMFRRKIQEMLPKPGKICDCHEEDAPPWTTEVHGLSQALSTSSTLGKCFWWLVMTVCVLCGIVMTVLVVVEYANGPTATSTTVKVADSLQFPAITLCPKVPDAFNETALLLDMNELLPNISRSDSIDLIRFFLGGNGLENMEELSYYNRTHINRLAGLYRVWSSGYDTATFFEMINNKYGYTCQSFFNECLIGTTKIDCCYFLFQKQYVMRRGICYKSKRMLNQTEADDIGRLQIKIRQLPSITSPQFDYLQPQIIAYVTDNYDKTIDFPRFYLAPYEWNRMRFTARYIDLIEKEGICTTGVEGRNAECLIRKWLRSNIVIPFNCTLSYLEKMIPITGTQGTCDPELIAQNYLENIEQIDYEYESNQLCIPGCERWDYTINLQSSKSLVEFDDHHFNLEVSYSELQYEYIKEVPTTTIPAFMSQIGGQFGFFLGLSIITFIQMVIYFVHYILTQSLRLFLTLLFHIREAFESLKKEILRNAAKAPTKETLEDALRTDRIETQQIQDERPSSSPPLQAFERNNRIGAFFTEI